jgi:hypothetical protein
MLSIANHPRCGAGATDQPKRVLVLVPTTGSVNRVERIEARPDLKVSQLLHRYWPQAISGYYAALTERPLAVLGAPAAPGVYLLWLAHEIESGNSWELPVLLAHLAVASGHELVDDPAEADIVLWATGEIDSHLRLRVGDYRLAAKVAFSEGELQQAAVAGARIIAIVPASEDAALLRGVLAASGTQDFRVESVVSVFDARGVLEQELGCPQPAATPVLQVDSEPPAPSVRRETRGLIWKIPALLAAGAAMALVPLIASNALPASLARATPPHDTVTLQDLEPRGWNCTAVLYRKNVPPR